MEKQIFVNLAYYAANYAMVVICCNLWQMVTSPLYVVVIVGCLGMTALVFEPPRDAQPIVASLLPTMISRVGASAVASACFLLITGFLAAFLGNLAVSVILVIAHAVTRPVSVRASLAKTWFNIRYSANSHSAGTRGDSSTDARGATATKDDAAPEAFTPVPDPIDGVDATLEEGGALMMPSAAPDSPAAGTASAAARDDPEAAVPMGGSGALYHRPAQPVMRPPAMKRD